jgi:hypothetical protein
MFLKGFQGFPRVFEVFQVFKDFVGCSGFFKVFHCFSVFSKVIQGFSRYRVFKKNRTLWFLVFFSFKDTYDRNEGNF